MCITTDTEYRLEIDMQLKYSHACMYMIQVHDGIYKHVMIKVMLSRQLYLLVFILVQATVLFFSPSLNIISISSIDLTSISIRPCKVGKSAATESLRVYLVLIKLRSEPAEYELRLQELTPHC